MVGITTCHFYFEFHSTGAGNFGEIHEGILVETENNAEDILIDHPKKVALKKLKQNENKHSCV